MKYWPAILALGLLAGCARFHPQPLSPAETAAGLESRSLANPDLKAFLEKNLHRDLNTWPALKWDFDMLTLAVFYYQPSLEVARASWRVAAGGIETAAERPNPTASMSGIYEPASGAYSPWIPGLVFDLPVETAGKRRFRTEQARQLSESARLNIATAAWQVRSQLRVSAIDYLSATRRELLLGQELAVQEQLHFALADLACWLRGYWDGGGARELVRDRTLRRQSWLAESAPGLIVEEPDGRMSVPAQPVAALPQSNAWSGIPVSPGKASGPVRLVYSPVEADRLQQGDILAAPATDPGWTPLFLRASAIVMETGGVLSHGAIVAREYGIPAVANIPGILSLLRDGERVTVDGSAGRVIREPQAP